MTIFAAEVGIYTSLSIFRQKKSSSVNPKIFSKNMRGLGNTAGLVRTAKKLTKKSVLPEEECTTKVAVPFLYEHIILKQFAFAMNKKLKVFDKFITMASLCLFALHG